VASRPGSVHAIYGWRAGWVFIGCFWLSWGPQLPCGRWSVRWGRA
jgi:hypothetical protein